MRPLSALPRGHVHLVLELRYRAKGHRANGFSTDGGFAEYAVNSINTLAHIPDEMTDAEATLIVTPEPRCTAQRDGRGDRQRGVW